MVEIDLFKLILKDLYNFFLQKVCKLKDNAYNFEVIFISNIIFFLY